MKKLLSLTLMAFGLLLMSRQAEASWYRGTAKDIFVSSYTTGSFLVTPAISTNSATAAQYMPGVIYQIVLSTGAASEYVILIDSGNCTNLGSTVVGSTGTTYLALTPRIMYGSTTTITSLVFDPPIRFDTGLCAIDSAATGQFAITYELGRGISGY
jgi:hypothetical protein